MAFDCGGMLSCRKAAAAFFVFALVSTTGARAQAPVQTSAQATAPPPDNEFYSLREPAAAGDAQAQFALANHYFRGPGVPQDYGHALIWYRKSAGQGYAPAQNQLGYMHQHKFGLSRDYKRALNYYRLAANQGYALAEYNLAAMFQSGLWVKRDYKQAFEWYRKGGPKSLGCRGGSRLLLSVRVWGQARLCSSSSLVSPRHQPRQL